MNHDPLTITPEQSARQPSANHFRRLWRIITPLRWLLNRFSTLQKLRAYLARYRVSNRPAVTAPLNLIDADPIPPRWPGTPAPAAAIRPQLDAALQRRTGDTQH